LNCDWYDIGCQLDKWFMSKWLGFTTWFWHTFETFAIVGIMSCLLMAVFGLEAPKKWIVWIIAIYVLAKFFQLANKVGII
jgi:hypothetical protein